MPSSRSALPFRATRIPSASRERARSVPRLLHEQAFRAEQLGALVGDRIGGDRSSLAQQFEPDLRTGAPASQLADVDQGLKRDVPVAGAEILGARQHEEGVRADDVGADRAPERLRNVRRRGVLSSGRLQSDDSVVERVGSLVLVALLRERGEREQRATVTRVFRDGGRPLALVACFGARLDRGLRGSNDAPRVARVAGLDVLGRGGADKGDDRECDCCHDTSPRANRVEEAPADVPSRQRRKRTVKIACVAAVLTVAGPTARRSRL